MMLPSPARLFVMFIFALAAIGVPKTVNAQDLPRFVQSQLEGAISVTREASLDACSQACEGNSDCRTALLINTEAGEKSGWCGLMPGSYDISRFGNDREPPQLDKFRARDLINAYRGQMGLPALTLHPNLTLAAKIHNSDIAYTDIVDHTGTNGMGPHDRVLATGYNARMSAENIAAGQWSLEEVIEAWQLSEGHNRNLLDKDARHMGIDLTFNPDSDYKTFWTLVLGDEKPSDGAF